MQTFLPLPSFSESARVLDRQRLGKQRVEVLQLLNAFDLPNSGWSNHPARKMWVGYKDALVAYGLAMCEEWIRRGYNDTCYEKILAHKSPEFVGIPTQENVILPKWFGKTSFHASHRGNLLRKDYQYYSQFGWTDSPLLFYEWPRQ